MKEGEMSTAYDFEFSTLQGKVLKLNEFSGRPLLIVNTASKCGFTPQYKGLQEVWTLHRDRGLMVIGVPSNQFGNQEPGTAEEIGTFCEMNYGIDFPLASKVDVKGQMAHPLFQWLADEGGYFSRPRWNFYKYLIDRKGRLRTWFSSMTSPSSPKFDKALKDVLK
jgi:glutathione peroxidase